MRRGCFISPSSSWSSSSSPFFFYAGKKKTATDADGQSDFSLVFPSHGITRICFIFCKMAARVFSGYRRLFRARKILFQGDDKAMRESRVEIRKQFEMNRAASDPAHIEGLLTMVDEAEDMLLHGIVRGDLNDQTGNYGECTAFEFLAMMLSLFFSGKSFADLFFSYSHIQR